MKLDLDPEKNRRQLGKLQQFSSRYTVMNKPWFYYFFGTTFALVGLVIIFGPEDMFNQSSSALGQLASGLLFLAIGASVIIACKLFLVAIAKIGKYKPKKNRGDEWNR